MPTKTARKEPIPAPPEWVDDGVPVEPATLIATTATPEELEPYMPEDDQPITAVTVTGPTSNSVIVGLGALAAMSDAEYEAKKAVMSRGLARVKDIQQSLMVDKEDYGKVPGIAKPFLQLPGAEKLANFYGYAVRQEVDRLVRQVGDTKDVPPLAYHVKSFVHLGSLDGPVIAQGFGEANSYEEKYRWRWSKATCPKCGREGMVRGKKDGPLQGKWWCPSREGGCNNKVEPNATDPDGNLLVQTAKVENDEPYGLAETLIQIAAKRSFVAAIRRATGTSGLFSQDDDSPSVQQQSKDSGAPDPDAQEPTISAPPVGIAVSVGAKSTEATQLQRKMLADKAKEKGLNGAKIADLLSMLFGLEVEPTGAAASAAVKKLNGVEIGRLLHTIETGEVPGIPEEATPGFPPQDS